MAAAAWLALLAACGGGVGTGGTGSFAAGPITGFGSIIVNDVHYDESAARIETDDGSGRSREALRLGMVVEVEADAVRNNAAVAARVRIVSERIGRVDSVAANSLVVNGLTVRTNAGTVFDAAFAGGLASVPPGSVVEVYGFSTGASAEVLATRIEPRPDAASHKFRGTVTRLDLQARTFRIGSQSFSYSPRTGGRERLADGALLRVTVEPARGAQGDWIVTSIDGGAPQTEGEKDVKANGVITEFSSPASFQVDGWTVDASAARIEDGPLALGQRVKVEGRLSGGRLIASEVRVVGNEGDDDFETRGRIVAIDPVARVFQLNGNRGQVSYARNDIVFEGGTLESLAVDRRVTVSGQLSANGTLIEARRIEFDDDDEDEDDEDDDDED